MALLVHEYLASSARAFPDKTAILHGERTASFREIESLSSRIGNLLLKAGLKTGDRVLVVMENSIENVASYYGVLKAGGVCVEIHDRSTPAETGYYVQNSGARICVLSKTAARRLEGIDVPTVLVAGELQGRHGQTVYSWGDLDAMPETAPRADLSGHDLAAIVYTSGSTGKPKGVVLTHRNLCSNTQSIVSYLGLTETDRVMAVLPFYYVYGKTLLNTHFMVGGSVVINNRFAFPNAVVKEMADREVTGFSGVPSTFAILMNRSIFTKTVIPSLRYVTQAGGPWPPR